MLLAGFHRPRRGKTMMRYLKYAALFGVLLFAAGNANAQWRVGVGVGPVYDGYYGPAPVCEYGYYDYYPYSCAPYGYYGSDFFVDGIFIGAGPWYNGFHGGGYYGGPGFYGRGCYCGPWCSCGARECTPSRDASSGVCGA